MVLVAALRVAGEPNGAHTVALDPEEIRVLGLEDLDVDPGPVGKALQRPDGMLAEAVTAANRDRLSGVIGPQTADAVLRKEQVPPKAILPFGVHVLLDRRAIDPPQFDIRV